LYEPREAFAQYRPHNTAVKVTVKRENYRFSGESLFIAAIAVVFGFLIYYVFILALFSSNLNLLLDIFLVCLVAILFALSLLFLNLHMPMMVALHYIFFFWEKEHVRQISRKNLISHSLRNRKTFLMYTIAIALVIYLRVVSKLQIDAVEDVIRKSAGAPVRVRASYTPGQVTDSFSCCKQALERSLLQDHSDKVQGFSWISQSTNRAVGGTTFRNLGNVFESRVDAFAVLPNFRDVIDGRFEKFDWIRLPDWPIIEQLYSAVGSQGMLVPSRLQEDIGLLQEDTFLADFETDEPYAKLRPFGFFSSIAALNKNRFSSRQPSLMSFPTYARLGASMGWGSIEDIPLRTMLISLKKEPDEDFEGYRRLLRDLNTIVSGTPLLRVWEFRYSKDALDVITSILRSAFLFLSTLALLICSFSLVTSMYANAEEQAKEIAVLRALGMQNGSLFRIGLVESVVLLTAAVFAGVLTGWSVGTASGLQQNLFLDLLPNFYFPVGSFVLVVVLALLSALLGARAISRTARNSVTEHLRAL